MIKYKIDVQAELVKRGYTTYRIKQDNLLPGQTLSNLKNGKMVKSRTLTIGGVSYTFDKNGAMI